MQRTKELEGNKMNLRKDLENSKGITLIALVVTIVVLIMLATITINIVVNGGIFQAAKETKSFHVNAERYDESQMNDLEKALNDTILEILETAN